MNEKEKLSKAFSSVRAPEDTLKRVLEKAQKEERKNRGLSFSRYAEALALALVVCLCGAGVFAAKPFSLSRGILAGVMKSSAQAPAAAPMAPEPALRTVESAAAAEDGIAPQAEVPAEQVIVTAAESDMDQFQISLPFGAGARYEETSGHSGIDFAAPEGTEVLAAAEGCVRKTGFDEADGNYVVIDHDFGFQTRYSHLASVAVSEGDAVSVGTVIGTVGNTGMSTGAHLHLELLLDEEPTDPYLYFENE